MQKAVLKKFNLRREPKNIANFRMRYGERVLPKFSSTLAEKKDVSKVVSYIKSLVGEKGLKNQGEGVQIVFPLTSSLGHGEFVRGVLKVLAPKTRVVFLPTANHTYFSSLPPEGHVSLERKQATKNLERNVSRKIKSGMRTVLVDDADSGGTFRAITEAMKSNWISGTGIETESTIPLGDFILRFYPGRMGVSNIRSLQLDWRKDSLGRFASDSGNYIRHLRAENGRRDSHYFEKAPLGRKPKALFFSEERAQTRQSNEQRRLLYNLGIAVGKEFRSMQQIGALK